jgi:tetratricopeptide (TPR) repeat protein
MTKKCLLVLLLLLSISFCNYAQLKENKSEIVNGLNLIYNFKWEEGGNIFRQIINKYPERPAGYHFMSVIYMWHYLSNKDQQTYNNFLAYSDSTLERAQKDVDKAENEENLYLLGSCYNYRAVVFAFKGNYLDAAYASKKAETALSKVVSLNKNNYDACFGLGLYNFAISQIPSGFSWVLKIAGINGSRQSGYNHLKLASEKGLFSRTESIYFFSQILMNDDFDYAGSAGYINKLTEQYPDNIIFRYAKAVLLIKQKNPLKAKDLLLSIYHTPLENFKKTVSFTRFLLGDVYYKLNMYDSASVCYSDFLKNLVDADYSGIAAYRCGICYEMLNNHNEAVKYFKLAKNGNRDLEDDAYAYRKGSTFLKAAITSEEKKQIYAENLLESGDYNSAENMFNALLKLNISSSQKAEIYFYLSEIKWNINNTDESINLAMQVKDLPAGNEEWIKPFALYNAARGYKSKNDFFKVKDLVDEVQSCSGYDYEQTLLKKVDKLNLR